MFSVVARNFSAHELPHQRVLRREVAVDRPDADPGRARDVVDLHARAVLGARSARGREDPLAVAPRVGRAAGARECARSVP